MGKLMKNGVNYSGFGSPGGSTVEVVPIQTTGTKIATITVDGVDEDIYAPSGGGGGSAQKVSWQNDAQGFMRYPRITYQPVQNSTQESGHVYYDTREYDTSGQVQKHIEINYDYLIDTGVLGGQTECELMQGMNNRMLFGSKVDTSKVTFSNNWVALYPGESGQILNPSFYLKSVTWDGTSDAQVTFGISFTVYDNGYYDFNITNDKTIPAANMSYALIQYQTLQTEAQ